MRVEINLDKIRRNVERAKSMTTASVSLMFKDFYEDIYHKTGDMGCKIFSKYIQGSVCYSLYNSHCRHKGCFVISFQDFIHAYRDNALRQFYVPINAHDDREGLSLREAAFLCSRMKKFDSSVLIIGVITSGCLNEKHPSYEELYEIWSKLSCFLESLSVGGSFWLPHRLPDFVSDVRIGEYMLYGTIPYNCDDELLGESAIVVKANVVGVFPCRNQVIVDCGYCAADVSNSRVLTEGLKFVDSSSEYAIFERCGRDFEVGEEIEIIPNYKSLVTLRNAKRDYIQER